MFQIRFPPQIVRNRPHKSYARSCQSPKVDHVPRQSVLDNSENVFYIYYIGRYDEEPIFHYGITPDLYSREFELRKHGIEKFIMCRYDVIDHHVWVKDIFEKHIDKFGIQRTIASGDLILHDNFALADDYNYHRITYVLDDLFVG